MRFAIRVKPGARQVVVGGRWDGDRGPALVVAVAAPAVEGRANDAVRAALAKAFGIRRRDVTIVTGRHGRDKIIELSSPPSDAPERLAELLDH